MEEVYQIITTLGYFLLSIGYGIAVIKHFI